MSEPDARVERKRGAPGGVVSKDLVIAATDTGRVAAVDAATGKKVWERRLGYLHSSCGDLPYYGITGTPTIDRATNSVYVGDGLGRVDQLSLSNGRIGHRWRFTHSPQNAHNYSALTLVHGTVYAEVAGYCDRHRDYLDATVGRFDREVVVPLPNRAERSAILARHARGKNLQPGTEFDEVAAATPGFSGADLANLANEAALNAARKGESAVTPLDFEEALDRITLGAPGAADPRRRVAAAADGLPLPRGVERRHPAAQGARLAGDVGRPHRDDPPGDQHLPPAALPFRAAGGGRIKNRELKLALHAVGSVQPNTKLIADRIHFVAPLPNDLADILVITEVISR